MAFDIYLTVIVCAQSHTLNMPSNGFRLLAFGMTFSSAFTPYFVCATNEGPGDTESWLNTFANSSKF